MKNKSTLFSLLFSLSLVGLAQTSFTNLDHNNVSARIQSDGYLFNDIFNSEASYEIPKGTGFHTTYAGSMWIGGINGLTGQLHIAAQRFLPGHDYFTGPIADNYDADYMAKYDRIWKVSKEEIDEHKNKWNDKDYVIPDVILNWPGNGDVSNGVAHMLAPFVDTDGDQEYNPKKGDYPCIRGDEAVFVIYNDEANLHTTTTGDALGIEVHLMAYSYSTSDEVNNTVFLNYTIYNRSINPYSDVHAGLWLDFDIGCSADDYLGCDTTKNLFYGYNGDAFDEDCSGLKGYGEKPPAFGATFLNQKMTSFMTPASGVGSPQGEPNNAIHFYNYLKSTWKDGAPLTFGGDGADPLASPTNYMYSGDPNVLGDWNETINLPGERRGIGSIGPFDLDSKDTLTFDMALVFARSFAIDQAYPSVSDLKAAVDVVKGFYDNQTYTCTAVPSAIEELSAATSFNVYPNPAGELLYLSFDQAASAVITMHNLLGEQVKQVFGNIDRIDVSDLDNGVYFVRLQKENKVVTKKVMVQH